MAFNVCPYCCHVQNLLWWNISFWKYLCTALHNCFLIWLYTALHNYFLIWLCTALHNYFLIAICTHHHKLTIWYRRTFKLSCSYSTLAYRSILWTSIIFSNSDGEGFNPVSTLMTSHFCTSISGWLTWMRTSLKPQQVTCKHFKQLIN